jgi:hypothetical protein
MRVEQCAIDQIVGEYPRPWFRSKSTIMPRGNGLVIGHPFRCCNQWYVTVRWKNGQISETPLTRLFLVEAKSE